MTTPDRRFDLLAGTDLPAPSFPLAESACASRRSLLRRMVGVVARPGVLSFAGGLPDPQLFPAEALETALVDALRKDGGALQYGTAFAPLRTTLVDLMRRRGVVCRAEDIVLTAGAQQGLQIATRLLVDPGDPVVLGAVTYPGMLQALAPLSPRLAPVSIRPGHGLDVDHLAQRLHENREASLIYVVPDHDNPTGGRLDEVSRRRLARLAKSFAVPIVEDDPYGLLTFDGKPLAPVAAHDRDWVVYVGSLSKIVAPALRLGWLALPPGLSDRAAIVKEAIDLESSALLQRAAAAFLASDGLEAHLERLRRTYSSRRDALLAALENRFRGRARWSRPAGGFFVWVELDEGIDTRSLLDLALEREGIAFVPGEAFATPPTKAPNTLRLCYSTLSESQIEDGIRRLARLPF